jgi:hypothetical protein
MRLTPLFALSLVAGCLADRVIAPTPARLASPPLLHIPAPTPARISGARPRVYFFSDPGPMTPYEMTIDDQHYDFPRDSLRIRRELSRLSAAIVSMDVRRAPPPPTRNRAALMVVIRTTYATCRAHPQDSTAGCRASK